MSDTKTALLVEDNDELRGTTREYFEEMGYAVAAAADAETALRAGLESAPGHGFDLLVSDLQLPGMNGIELADRLLSRRPELAVLLISSHGGEPAVRRRLARGDVAFLAKPFSPAELTTKVAEAFARVSEGRSGEALEATPEPPDRVEPAKSRLKLPRGVAQLVGALALVLGFGVLLRSFELDAPPLPAPDPESVVRGGKIEIVRPLGPLAATPAELVWRPIDGASSYDVSLRAIDGTALWQAEVVRPPATVPAAIGSGLDRLVTYYWSVEALDAERQLLGRSEFAPFVIELASHPAAAEPPAP